MRPLCFFLFPAIFAFSQPQEPLVLSGDASLNLQSPDLLEIVAADKTIIQWDQFNIEANETTRFIQPNTEASVLNRVMEANPSRLKGRLESNGQVLLINPNGILVGNQAQINTGSFIASSLDINQELFLTKGQLQFFGESDAIVENEGFIQTNGDLFLIGPHVENRGTLEAQGTAGLVATRAVSLGSDQTVFVRTNWGETDPDNPFAGAFKIAEKPTFAHQAGDFSGKDLFVLGDLVFLDNGSLCDASGYNQGGKIFIGGDFQGNNPALANAKQTWIAPEATIRANALSDGDGGRVITWGDNANLFYGKISAKGGEFSGDGGFVEVSSPGFLDFQGSVIALAPAGKTGTLLLDPAGVSIGGVTSNWSDVCPTGFIGNPAVVGISIANLLSALSGCSVTIDTSTSSGAGTGTIILSSALSIPNGSNSLTLKANANITLVATLTNNNTTTTSAITLTAGNEIINDSTITLAAGSTGDLDMNAVSIFPAGAITNNATASNVNLTTTTGNVTLNNTILFGPATTGNLNINSGGTISQTGPIAFTAGSTSSFTATAAANIALDAPINDFSTGSMTITSTGSSITSNGAGAITFSGAAPSQFQMMAATTITLGGAVTLEAGSTGTVNITGGTGVAVNAAFNNNSGTANTVNITATTGNLTSNVAGAITNDGGAMTLQATAGNITIGDTITDNSTQATGSIALNAGGSITTNGAINFSAATTAPLTLTANAGITINKPITILGSSNTTINDNGSTCAAPTATLIGASVQNSGPVGMAGNVILNKTGFGGTVTVQSVGGSIAFGSLNGLSQINSPNADLTIQGIAAGSAQVGFHMAFGQQATGSIDVSCYNLNVLGQTINVGFIGMAQIGHGNPDSNGAGTGTATLNSNITVNAGNDITMTGGIRQAFAWIGHGSFRAAGSSCADPSANQIGNITVTAGRNLNMNMNNPVAGTLDTVVIGHGIGDSGGGSFVAQLTGNISVTTGCDLNITNTQNNQIHIGSFWNVGGEFCNLTGDIDIVTGRDLNITLNPTVATSSVFLGHSNVNIPNLTGNERIRVGRDLNIAKTASTSGITLGFGRLSTNAATVINGDFELLVNRDIIINSNVVGTGSSEIAIGMYTTDLTGTSSTYVAAGRNILWQSADEFTGIEGSELPGSVAVAAGGNIEISFLAGTTAAPTAFNFFLGTNNYASAASPATTYIWAGGSILGINQSGAAPQPQVAFGFGSTAAPAVAARTFSLDMRAVGDIQYSNHTSGVANVFDFETAGTGSINLLADFDFSAGPTPLWTNTASTLTQICNFTLPAALQLPNASIPSLCNTACNCTAPGTFCAPSNCPCPGTASPFWTTTDPAANNHFGAFYVFTDPVSMVANFTNLETNSGIVNIHSGCTRADQVTLQNLSVGTVADNAADTVKIFSNSGNVTIDGFNILNINQSASFPTAPTTPTYTGNITLKACVDIDLNESVITQGAGSTILINSDEYNTGAGNVNINNVDVTTNNGNITLLAGPTSPGATSTSSINQTGNTSLVSSGTGVITATAGDNILVNGAATSMMTTTGNITLTAGGQVDDDQIITSTSGNISGTAGTNFNINTPNGMLNTGGAGTVMVSATTGNILVNGQANSIVTGTGLINLTAGTTINDDQTITSTSGDITGLAGTDININFPNGQINTGGAGSVLLTATAGNILVNGQGNSIVTVDGPVNLTAGISINVDETITSTTGSLFGTAGLDINFNNTFGLGQMTTGGAGLINLLAGRNILANGKNPTLMTVNGSITGIAINNIDIDQPVTSVNGNITLNADSDNSGVGNLTINNTVTSTSGNICLLAGAGTFGCSQNNCSTGMLSGFPAGNSTVSITGSGSATSTTGAITLVAADDVTVSGASPSITTAGPVALTAGFGDLTVTQQVVSSGSTILTFAGNNTTLTQTTGPGPLISALGQIRMLTGLNMTLNPNTAITSSSNEVTLIVDNIHPVMTSTPFPASVSGSFTMLAGTSITGSPLRIFTAYSQTFGGGTGMNFVDPTALLNGIIPSSLGYPTKPFNNTPYEQWCSFFSCAGNYPFSSLGVPFTFVYKPCLQQITPQAQIIVSQFLVDLHPYNEFPGWMERFFLEYAAGDAVSRKSASSSIYELGSEPFYLRRRLFNILNQPKSWTQLFY